ncbi:hypothetical protein SHM_25270 [Spiroplasma ixodetis]|uniref:Insertion element IS402-like domain-containing protein n=1 Tax=Spiroplasma ixodetis TaxID=2141 RepID=A0ABN6T4I6_9MOLU|nr:hypothetical protein SHM_25270 [Spiroplasma ixodetis]
MHKNYPSHVTKEQFENIKSTLENSKKKTKPRNLDLYEVFCAVLYVLKSGCQWRMLPKNFPKWQTVYYYFQIWSKNNDKEPSVLQLILKKIRAFLPLCTILILSHKCWEKPIYGLLPTFLNQT